jgi:hypothetical protein
MFNVYSSSLATVLYNKEIYDKPDYKKIIAIASAKALCEISAQAIYQPIRCTGLTCYFALKGIAKGAVCTVGVVGFPLLTIVMPHQAISYAEKLGLANAEEASPLSNSSYYVYLFDVQQIYSRVLTTLIKEGLSRSSALDVFIIMPLAALEIGTYTLGGTVKTVASIAVSTLKGLGKVLACTFYIITIPFKSPIYIYFQEQAKELGLIGPRQGL